MCMSRIGLAVSTRQPARVDAVFTHIGKGHCVVQRRAGTCIEMHPAGALPRTIVAKPMNTTTDSEPHDRRLIALLDRIAARGPHDKDAERALREMYELCAPRLHGLAMRVLRRTEWAEDVLQETFLQIWRSAGDYRGSLSPPLAWMGVMVRSRALDFLRRRAAQRVDAAMPLDEAEAENETVDEQATDPLDATQASQLARSLHDCLRRLEPRQREAVSLAYLRDLSHSELAEQLRLPLGTVKSWIRRGLDQLRGCMAGFA